MNETNYVVYRHTSPSDKVYIGITCQKPEKRWNNGNGYKDSLKFYNSIQKYGWDNFKHEILFSGLNEISAKMIEEDLIYYYKKQNKSYNITDGGDGIKGYKHSEETKKKIGENSREVMKNPDTRKKLSERMKINNPMKDPDIRRKMSNAKKGKPSNFKGKHHSEESKEKLYKSVSQFSLDGNLIATYKSIKEAASNNNMYSSHIGSVCKGDRKTAVGYIWRFSKN